MVRYQHGEIKDNPTWTTSTPNGIDSDVFFKIATRGDWETQNLRLGPNIRQPREYNVNAFNTQ